MIDKAKSKTRSVMLVVMALSGCAACAALIAGFHARYRRDPDPYNMLMTSNELELLAGIIQSFVKQSGRQPPEDINSLPAFIEEIQPGVVDIFANKGWLDPNNGWLVDYRRNPLRLVVDSPHRYRLISAGANGRYQNGKGDDIVHDFDPWQDYQLPGSNGRE
ncbi:MAG: hypothetical protein ACYTBJ_20445 [Planctomycetota bacterium]